MHEDALRIGVCYTRDRVNLDDLAHDDVRYPAALARAFLAEYTRPGDLVFDPFAGFGTTLRAAEELGRRGLGIEYAAHRCAYARARLRVPDALLHGDSRRLSAYGPPRVDFSITSPPTCAGATRLSHLGAMALFAGLPYPTDAEYDRAQRV